jgi:hypothetical protein
MFDFLKKAEDKLDVAKTAVALLDVATHFQIVPGKKRIYVWCRAEDVERVKEIFGGELMEVKELRGKMRLVVGTY